MSAYNWLSTSVKCNTCGHVFSKSLQIPIGWCQYYQYKIGDHIIWMNQKDRDHVLAIEKQQRDLELRTAIEIGDKNWQNFTISAGDDYECPKCHTMGTILVLIRDNKFESSTLVKDAISYGHISLI